MTSEYNTYFRSDFSHFQYFWTDTEVKKKR